VPAGGSEPSSSSSSSDPPVEAVRAAWHAIFHLARSDLWRYRVALLLFVGLVVEVAVGTQGWLILVTVLPGIALALSVLIPLRRRFRDHPDRTAATAASRRFARYVLTGREP
jgi:hypothetical protein